MFHFNEKDVEKVESIGNQLHPSIWREYEQYNNSFAEWSNSLRTDVTNFCQRLFVRVKEKNDYVYTHATIQIFAFYFHSNTNV